MEHSEKTLRNKVTKVVLDFGTNSTIGGIANIVHNKTTCGRIYWILSVLFLISLASYSSYSMYRDWKTNQVTTYPYSTGIPVRMIPFPGVIFCSNVYSWWAFKASFIKQAQEILKKQDNRTFLFSPYDSVKMMMTKKKNQTVLDELMIYFNGKKFDISTLDNQFPNGNLMSLMSDSFTFISADYIRDFFIFASIAFAQSPMLLKLEHITMISPFDILMNKTLTKIYANKNLKPLHYKIQDFKDFYKFILPHMWYTKNPCMDIKGITASENYENSLFTSCKWKSVDINCGAIFMVVETDEGMCCGFNIDKANNIFYDTITTKLITDLVLYQKENAFENTTIPLWYDYNMEPISRVGLKMGLEVKLNDVSSRMYTNSLKKNFNSVSVLLLPSNDFPLVNQKGFRLRKQHRNIISVRGTVVNPDLSLKAIKPEYRRCLFEDDISLKYFKRYGKASCDFECLMLQAKESLLLKGYSPTCLPWNFPLSEDDTMCNQTQQKDFIDVFGKKIGLSKCSICMPDCSFKSYTSTFSIERLRNCDDLSLSPFCSWKDRAQFYKPSLLLDQALQQLGISKSGNLSIFSRYRETTLDGISGVGGIFQNSYSSYDAFERDFLSVIIFIDSYSIWEFRIIPTSSWSIYLSGVGGIFGLFISISIVSLAEVVLLIFNLNVTFLFNILK